MSKVASIILAMMVVAASAAQRNAKEVHDVDSTGEDNQMDMILNHCPVLCSPDLKESHPLRHLVPTYQKYGICMDDCICAAYCYMLDSTMEGQAENSPYNYDNCFTKCSTEVKPFTSSEGDMEMFK